MADVHLETGGTGPSHRNVEFGVAAGMAVVALIGIYGSVKVGIGWAADGPRAGFFPFYVSLIVLMASLVTIAQTVFAPRSDALFASWSQLRQVLSVLVPTIVYVALVPYAGIYVMSGILIAFFMRWFGRYRWVVAIAIGVAVPVLTFFTFEMWFLVPLPKGPLESMLGY